VVEGGSVGLNRDVDPGFGERYRWRESQSYIRCWEHLTDEDHMNTVNDFFPCEIIFHLLHNGHVYSSLVVRVFRKS